MARIRTIKPEFPHSESIGTLSRDARLLFIMLWTVVDDLGRTRGSSRMLASLLYPYDNDAPKLIGGWLTELEEASQIRRYVVDGSTYLDIPKWLEHQKIDHPSKSRIPEFLETSRSLASEPETIATDLGPSTIGPSTKNIAPSAHKREFDEDFKEFYSAYPKKKAKRDAEKAYAQMRRGGATHAEIMAGLSRAPTSDERWREQKYIPYPASWLRDGCFLDDISEKTQEQEAVIDLDMARRGYEWKEGKWAKSDTQ